MKRILWALLGIALVFSNAARADHDPNPTPSVEECREILAEFPDETWYKSRNFHGRAQPCDVLKAGVMSRGYFEARRDAHSKYPEEWAVDPQNTWEKWLAARPEVHPSWLIEWGEVEGEFQGVDAP